MKFRWKIFFLFTALISLVFGIFGVWMIQATFQASLEREIERGKSENQMFQLAFEMAINSTTEEYLLVREKVVQDVVGRLKNNISENTFIRVYGNNQKILYDDTRVKIDNRIMEYLLEVNSGYVVEKIGDAYYLQVMCRSDIEDYSYYLENIMEITFIYDAREELIATYRLAMVVLLVTIGFIMLILTHYLTRSVVVLSKATKRFSTGNYQVRAKKRSQDEIGQLTEDFNSMADSLSQKIERLSEEARRQEDFTSSFAHELKTPLTSIIGYSDMLRSMKLEEEETVEFANYIYSQGKRLESLSFKLMELLNVEKQNFEIHQYGVPAIFEEVRNIITASIIKRKITLIMEAEEGFIHGEKDLLISLLVNLADNGRKAMEEGGTLTITGVVKPDGYEVLVKDTGCGIPSEEVEKLTEAFYMVDKSRARKEGGAGLGMTLCSKILLLHNGKWYINSNVGEGTEIRLVFPVTKGDKG